MGNVVTWVDVSLSPRLVVFCANELLHGARTLRVFSILSSTNAEWIRDE
jgi:hypothetical protein